MLKVYNQHDQPAKQGKSRFTAEPTFEEFLAGDRDVEPWLPKTFLNFLKTEVNEENFIFFEEIEALKVLTGKTVPLIPTDDLLLLPSSVRTSPEIYSKSLAESFVKEGAEHQVNISDNQRSEILERLTESNFNSIEQAFEGAQKEVKLLMQRDSWPRFLKKVTRENVSIAIQKARLKEAIFHTLVSLIASVLMLTLHAPRYYLILTIIPNFLAVQSYRAYRRKFCPILAMRAQRGEPLGPGVVPQQCPYVRRKTKAFAIKTMFTDLLIAVIITGFIFSITYIVEAANGGVNIYH